ncbi:MAG: hypothetical protein PHC78_09420 [Verrucomicrobiota bacterium]|nr:hypothetical protein [Verrucomicrobiota bacterium]
MRARCHPYRAGIDSDFDSDFDFDFDRTDRTDRTDPIHCLEATHEGARLIGLALLLLRLLVWGGGWAVVGKWTFGADIPC